MAKQSNSIPGHGYSSSYLDSLIWGCGWTGGSPIDINYFFGEGDVSSSRSSLGVAFTGASWSDREKSAFEMAITQYEAVCNVDFQLAQDADTADIVWWLVPNSAMPGYLGMHEVPDNSKSQIYGYFNYQDLSWQYLDQGEYGFITIIHELGHGMGLAHPHDGGNHADATLFPGVSSSSSYGTYGLNQGIWTTMSYNDGWNKAPSYYYEYGWQGTLMALDVAALQKVYGANMSTATGNDVYQLPGTNGVGAFWFCIWDAGGTDTISNKGSSIACTINLNEAPLTGANAGGYVSKDNGIIGGYTIASGAVIENAVGGAGNDTLIGNAANNILDGGAGIDVMSGGLGNDTYYVDNARDTITEAAGSGTDTVCSAITAYTLGSNLENLMLLGAAKINGTGNDANNCLTGNNVANVLSGWNGNDILIGAQGADRLTGGGGSDIFRYLSVADSWAGALDTITDFQSSRGDRLDFSAIDANPFKVGDQAFSFIGVAPFSGSEDNQLRFSYGFLYGDTNGDSKADFGIQLVGVSSLNSSSMIL